MEEKKKDRPITQLKKALDLIIELVKDDPSEMCLVVDAHNKGYCEKNCTEFNRVCLLKYLEHYNEDEQLRK